MLKRLIELIDGLSAYSNVESFIGVCVYGITINIPTWCFPNFRVTLLYFTKNENRKI